MVILLKYSSYIMCEKSETFTAKQQERKLNSLLLLSMRLSRELTPQLIWLLLTTPCSTLFNPLAVITMFLVIGKSLQKITWKITALSAMFQFLAFTAHLNCTFSPEGFFKIGTAGTTGFLLP
jgi:hypothetical protein